LEEKDRQKDQFIAVIAHELRNPLAAIRSAPTRCAACKCRTKSMLAGGGLDRQSIAMTRMLEDLQDASRAALGQDIGSNWSGSRFQNSLRMS
jgi:signal transduction histidine kinase